MIREGYIEKIVYKSDETGYCVMSVEGEEGEEIFVGTLPGAGEGLYVIAEGEYVNHPQYDIQFKFSSCEIQMPKDTLGIERYLGSGIIKGIGAVLAKKIVKKFKDDTLRIIEEEPERLAEISGISEPKGTGDCDFVHGEEGISGGCHFSGTVWNFGESGNSHLQYIWK